MAMIRWEPTRELQSVQSEINRLFNTLFDAPASGQAAATRRWVPAMDLVETEQDFVLRADLPGLKEEDIKIELQENVLTISGERKSEHEQRGEGFYRLERASGAFSRSLTLPEGVEADEVKANFDAGVLEVRIPKPRHRQPQTIRIGVGDQAGQTVEGSESSAGASSNAELGGSSAGGAQRESALAGAGA
jgi:HSP20 family protein